MHPPLISVILPLHHPWEATERTYATLHAQTIPFELLTADGSHGAPAARNAGALHACGKYLFFCDQDVELDARCLEYGLATLERHPEAGYAYADYDRAGELTGRMRAHPFDARSLRRGNFIDTCSLLRASIFPRFDESLDRLQDWDLWLTLLDRGIEGIYIPRCLYTKYYRAGDISCRDDYAHWHRIVSSKHKQDIAAVHSGGFCTICKTSVDRFLPGGPTLRPDARCPTCDSLERHRLLWLYLEQHTDLPHRKPHILHVAPEPGLARALRSIPGTTYVSVDQTSDRAQRQMDVQALEFPDASFDLIIASHVLEHVEDDRKAMQEFKRTLRPGGWAFLQVPTRGERTIEDPAFSTPQLRKQHYGQEDHLRQYGSDFPERLREAGFDVSIDPFVRTLSHADIRRFGLLPDEDLYVCRAL